MRGSVRTRLSDQDLEARYTAPFGSYALSESARKKISRAARHDGAWYYNLVRSSARRHLRRHGEMTDMEYRGCRIRLLPGENTDDMSLVMTGEHPERQEIEIFEARIRGKRCFVDIGANIGIYSLIAARLMEDDACILSFEPHPRTVIKLRANATLNRGGNRITVVEKAVGRQDSSGTLHIRSRKNDGQNTLRASAAKREHTVEVRLVPLVDELEALGVSAIDLLKIDVEGYEDEALVPFFEMAPRRLWPRYVMLEICHSDKWSRDVLSELRGLGYAEAFRNEGNVHLELPESSDKDEEIIHG